MKTIPALSHLTFDLAKVRPLYGELAAGLKEAGEIADQIQAGWRADLDPLAKIQPPLSWESWTPTPCVSEPRDIPEWEFREIAFGSF